MKNSIEQLQQIIYSYSEKLNQLNDDDSSLKSLPGKWSKKEELGHLIDSAHNNLRRFLVAQYEMNPKIVYSQNEWVRMAAYQKQPVSGLIQLWVLLNWQIAIVLETMPPPVQQRQCDTGKDQPELHSLEWLAEDYIKHLLHHLHHILELEAVDY